MTRLRGLAALLIAAAFVVGVPWLLVHHGRWPFGGVSSTGDVRDLADTVVSDTMVFGVLTVAAWLVWATFTLSLLIELVAAIRGVQAPQITFAGPLQRTARGLVAAIVLAFALSHGQPASFAAAPQRMPQLPTRASAHIVEMPQPLRLPTEAPASGPTPTTDETPVSAAAERTITVACGDSVWALAEEHLGDGLRWRELWELNRNLPQPDGGAWTDPQIIRVGWQLLLPADAASPPVVPAVVETATSPTTYEVVTGDTLSGIAETQLGHASRYREIFELNRGREQPDGRRLTDPNLIVTGWRLELPSIGGAPSPAPTPTVEMPPAESAPAEPVPVPAIDESAATPADAPTTTAPRAPVTVSPSSDAGTPPPFTSMPERIEPASTAADSAEIDDESWWATKAPLLVGVSGATVLATGLLLRIRRSQRRGVSRGASEAPITPPVVEHAVAAAADVPLVRWAGQALATAMSRLDARNAARSAPLAVELSADAGIEVLWDAPNPAAPAPWAAVDEGWAWRLPFDPDANVAVDALPAALPALATIGTREGRQLLVDLEAFGTLAVTGDAERVDDFLRSVALELSTGDDLADSYVLSIGVADVAATERLMTVDVETAAARASAVAHSVSAALDSAGTPTTFAYRAGADGVHLETTIVVIAAGPQDPAAVAGVRPRTGVALVVAGQRDDAGARIEVGSDGTAKLEPLGVSFIAAGLPRESAELVAELATEAADQDDHEPSSNGRVDPSSNGHCNPSANCHHAARINGHDAPALPTGLVEMPCLDGEPLRLFELPEVDIVDETPDAETSTRTPLDAQLVVKVLGTPRVPDRPKLRRRELIMTVFLACRGGRVNASAVLDALWCGKAVQGKTVWNLVGETRTALGLLPDGTEVMLPADRTLRMKGLSPAVTTDLAILRYLYEQAQTVSSSEAIDLLRRGLALVEGPPFDADGYDWAHHGTQDVSEANRLIEQAAEQLVNLALDNDDVETAREAVAQGLRGLPGDEVLYRLRMKVEHHTGNLTGVTAAYDELMSHLAEFDADPSPSTLELRRELLGAMPRQ